MEWKDIVDMGLGTLAFLAFVKLVFQDVHQIHQRLQRLEDESRMQSSYLSRLVNAVEAQAYRRGLLLKKEGKDGE